MLYAEAEGFAHLHVHLVPRMPDQPEERRGPAVFGYLAQPGLRLGRWVIPSLAEEMARIARQVARGDRLGDAVRSSLLRSDGG